MPYMSIKDGRVGTGKKTNKLTPKMLSFIDAYMGAARGMGLEAIRLSDYQCTTPASIQRTYVELMDHPLVKAEIDRRMALRSQKSEVKAEYLIEKLLSIINDSESEKTADRLRAIELAGKAIALWKERQEISGPDGEALKVEQQTKESVDEFTRRISSLAKRNRTDNVTQLPVRQGKG